MRERDSDILQRYQISDRTGFLSNTRPLSRLPHPYYAPWEILADQLVRLIARDQIRDRIDDLVTLDIDHLENEAEYRRAYSLLGFLTHAYIWGGTSPSQRLPPQLTRPLLAVAGHLGLTPTLTFAGISLWNFRLETPNSDPREPDNLKLLLSFTGTKSEEWFYMISTAIEATGGPLLAAMLRCVQAVETQKNNMILSCIEEVAAGIRNVGKLLQRMHEHCDPQIFYHNVRPFCAGTKGMAAAGLPSGVFYDEGNGKGCWKQYAGGSNGQSSLIQLFDVFLGVNHSANGEKRNSTSPLKAQGYLQDMRYYMPCSHREFLLHIERTNSLREYVSTLGTSSDLAVAYNDAVTALTGLREIHLQIVARYIVTPSRSPPAPYVVLRKGSNLATASLKSTGDSTSETSIPKQDLHGTGGTSLMPFLKRTRDETRDAAMLR